MTHSSNNRNPIPKVVVVNDSTIQLDMLCILLQKGGLKPIPFKSAETALTSMVQDSPPALIITDLYMPGIDGWRFCRLLRSPEYVLFNQVPILVVSATFSGDEPSQITSDLGANAFLPMPVDGQQFVEQVQVLLKGEKPLEIPKVLIVEDNKLVSKRLIKAFQAYGYQADAALTFQEGLNRIGQTSYDLAVLDYHLPDGLGDGLLKNLQEKSPDCVSLMMTDEPQPEIALIWMKMGAAAYLQKPFKPEYLIAQCERARRECALLRIQDLLEVRNQQLHESEENYHILSDDLPVYVVTFLPGGIITHINHALAALVGMKVDEIIGRSFFDFLSKQDLEVVKEKLESLCLEHPTETHEQTHQTPDGTLRWQEWTNTAIFNDEGQATCYQAIGQDITGRKQIEKALSLHRDLIIGLNSREGLHEALTFLLDSMLQLDSIDSGGVYAIDPGSGDLNLIEHRGLSPDFIACTSNYPLESSANQLARTGQIRFSGYVDSEPDLDGIRQEGLRTLVVVPILYEGQLLALLNLASHMHDEIPAYIQTILETVVQQIGSILSRIQTSAALKDSEALFRATIEQSFDGIVIVDQEFRIIEWNTAQANIFGYSREEMIGKPLWEHWFAALPDEQKSPRRLKVMKEQALHFGSQNDPRQMDSLQIIEIQH